RAIEARDLFQQRRALDVLLPGATDFGIDLEIGQVVERGERLKALITPLAVDAMPLAIVIDPPAGDADEAMHALRVPQRVGQGQGSPSAGAGARWAPRECPGTIQRWTRWGGGMAPRSARQVETVYGGPWSERPQPRA